MAFAACAMKVVAEVDVDLGLTRVVWIGAAQDVGKAINPQQVEGQIEGGTAQGLGLALMEEIQTRDGLITNASFTDYLIPTTLDMPPVESVLIEDPEPDAPYGVEGRRRAADRRLDRGGRGGAARGDGPRPDARAGPPGRHLPLAVLQRLDVRDERLELCVGDDAAPVRHRDDRRAPEHAARPDDVTIFSSVLNSVKKSAPDSAGIVLSSATAGSAHRRGRSGRGS